MIRIKFKDGRPAKVVRQEYRAGGSYSIGIKYEPGFLVVFDVWDNSFSYPTEDIMEVVREGSY